MRSAIGPYPPRFHSVERPARPIGTSSARLIGLTDPATTITVAASVMSAHVSAVARVRSDAACRERQIPITSPVVPAMLQTSAVREPDVHMPTQFTAKTNTAAQ